MTTTTINQTLTANYREQRTSPIAAFFTWCEGQEKNRMLWTAIALSVHGCILTPITVLLVAMTGINMILLTASILAMTFVLITNLAALPAKYTVPTFLLSIVVDVIIIIAAFAMA